MITIDAKKNLHTATGDLEAHYELSVSNGEFITLFGTSGAGKTTLLRLIAGLEKPDSGIIEVNGDVWFDSARRINLPPQQRSVGFVFQDYALFPSMSVRENLLFAAENEEQRRNVDELIELVELSALSDRHPDTLSGGQKQRVALARALVRRPKILLLDEPLSALDPSMRQKLQDELALIHSKLGVTTLLVSHDITETVKLSDRLASVASGQIEKICSPMEFFSPHALSGKLQLVGEVLKIEKDDPVFIITLLVGSSLVRTVASADEASLLSVGAHAIISTKAFNPILIPVTKRTTSLLI
ncbi:MAG: ATP-binding cassette domain-containing protein [Sulfuricurvum sp.]|jgi:molybdate transport system ATP-binding protein|uniref:ABC transporter ATP-binding protein n=1 Tax=Sulfuricurvum sp. TaxID=2025608 RepID=UPI0025FF486C|nr:ATP-binding cassette domain-containing protein [Sulfuricurvum sp.]MCI4406640.1 ATP-binding cassette domain-containing protein [Sulfuricurvum sp.]